MIPVGTLVHSEKPFLYVLSSKKRLDHCDNCLIQKTTLLKCSACQYVYYCNKDCQKQSWLIHKLECKRIRKISPRILPDSARFLARLIFNLSTSKGGDQIAYYDNNRKFRKFKNLTSHYTDVKNDKNRMEHFVSLMGVLEEFFDPDFDFLKNSAEILGIYGRMCVNSFTILDYDLNNIGTAIYLGASTIDHSCDPNVVVTFDGPKLFIRTIKKIQSPLDWSKIFISYIGSFLTTEERQAELKQCYYFSCNCIKCLDLETDRKALGAQCPSCKNGIICLPSTDNCDNCKMVVDDKFVKEFDDVMELTKFHLKNDRNIAHLDVCKLCLKKHKNILHDMNLYHVRILENTFDASIDLNQYDLPLEIADQLIRSFRFYHGDYHPVLGLINMMTSKIYLTQNSSKVELKKAECHLREALKILNVTHGRDHSIFKTVLNPLVQQLKEIKDTF